MAEAAAGAGFRVLRGAERYVTRSGGIETRHCFSFGNHYDPDNIGFGPITAINEESIAAGHGYDAHRHRAVEIVTWVLEGSLRHEDSVGNSGIIRPGDVQRLTAGRGVEHSERNASPTEPLRLVQMWLRSELDDVEPSYAQLDAAAALAGGTLVRVVRGLGSPAGDGAIEIGTPGAELWIGRLEAGESATLPAARLNHLHVTSGSVRLPGIELNAGDTVRMEHPRSLAINGVSPERPSQFLVWSMHPPS